MKNYTIDRNELANWLNSQPSDIPVFASWDGQNCPTAVFLNYARVQERDAEESFSVSLSGQITIQSKKGAFRDVGNIDRFLVAFELSIDCHIRDGDSPRSLPVTPRQAKQIWDRISSLTEVYEVESIIHLLHSLEPVDIFNLTPAQQKRLEPLK